jgi:hypothetical protein
MENLKKNTTQKRHWSLTVLLTFMIITNSVIGFRLIFFSFYVNHPFLPKWSFGFVGITNIINAICAIAIFRWKKWGFWGLCISALLLLIISLSLSMFRGAFSGVLSVLILYGVLQIGEKNKGWPQLE